MISIIIAFAQGTDYLKDCLSSIEEQEFHEIETILVIDQKAGNPDEISELQRIEQQYRKSVHLKRYELSDKTGVSAARNLGMEKAQGEYVFFLDSDDYVLNQTLCKLNKATTGDKSPDLVYCSIYHTWFKRAAFHVDQGDVAENEDRIEPLSGVRDVYTDQLKRFEKIEDVTVLGILYKKAFLEEHQIRFREEQKYYADFEFVLDALKNVKDYVNLSEEKECIYVKRYHNDTIHLPSLSQKKDEHRDEYLAQAYERGLQTREFREHVCDMFCRFYLDVFSRRFHEDRKRAMISFSLFSAVLAQCDKSIIKKFSWIEKRILKNAVKANQSKVEKWSKVRLAEKKVFKMFSGKKHFYRTINLYLFNRMKLKNNWIVFESFVGRNYSGQPKYIYQYLQKHYKDQYQYIWVVNDKKLEIDGNCKKVKRFGLMYYYYMTRSKYWVNNMRQPHSYKKRTGQIMLETWHGTPLKRLVFDMEDVHSASPKYKQIVYEQSRDWDYLLSDNPFSTEKFQSCFLYDKKKILELGYPANDPLYGSDLPKRAEELKKKLGIPQDKKVLLYAPTWRDDNMYGAGEYKFELALDLHRLYQEIGQEYVILLRMHYWVVDRLDLTGLEEFVMNVSNYSDITELYIVSDICMTDYSSVFFDYANLKRPILFYMYDLEKYRDVLRGFYLDIENDLPGPILTDYEQVLWAIKNISQVKKEYEEKYKTFYRRFCCIDDGNAAKRVCERVFR